MRFDRVAGAFLDGQLSCSKVRLLLPYLSDDNELELLALALSLSVTELKLALAGRGDADDGTKPREDTFRIWIDDATGRYRLSGDLNPTLGAAFAAALKCGELANLRDLSEIDEELLADETAVDKLVEDAQSKPAAVDAESTGDTGKDAVTRFGPPMRSALLSGLQGMISLARTARTSSVRAPGAQVHVMVTEDGHAFIPSAPGAPADALRNLIFDGEFRGHLLDSKGVTMKMGRKHRLVTDGQATALLARWLFQCAMPGCNHARFLEFRHITDYSAGGPTDVGNPGFPGTSTRRDLVDLCCCYPHLLITKRIHVKNSG